MGRGCGLRRGGNANCMKACTRPYCEMIQQGTVSLLESNHNKRVISKVAKKRDLKIDAGAKPERCGAASECGPPSDTFWPHSNELPLDIPHPARIGI